MHPVLPRLLSRQLLVTLLMLFPFSSYAWNAMGHMVVAQIAYMHLKPNVKKNVDVMVKNFNEEYPDMKTLLNLAYWPDQIRSQKINTYARWHYINSPFSVDGTPLKNTIDSDNAVWAINNIIYAVHNANGNPFERMRFLAFLVHIVGDLHQPLHTVTYLSVNHPNGDKGGNTFYVRNGSARTKLHELWDNGLGSFAKEPTIQRATDLAQTLTARYPMAYFGNLIYDLEPMEWVNEGVSTAKQYVYNTPENGLISANYISNGKRISEERITLAGYRLAEILNNTL